MQRSLITAIVLLIALLAAGLWWLQSSATVAPDLPKTPQMVAPEAADVETGSGTTQPEQASVPTERAVASTADATTAKAETAVLRVHAIYKQSEQQQAQLPAEQLPAEQVPADKTDRQPASGVLITLRWATREHAYQVREQVVTDAAGLATFVSVPPGRWSLRSDRGARKSFDLEPGETDITFELDYGVSVAGLVVNSKQQPVGNASVWLQSRSPDWAGGNVLTTTGSDGRFLLEHIPAHVSLGAFARNYTRSPLVDLDVIDTTTPPAKVTLQLLDKGGQLSGVVINKEGKPIANALLGIGKQDGRLDMRGDRIIERWSVRSTKTGSDGRFLLEGLQPGPTTIAVKANGYGFWRSDCEIVDQQDQEITIEVERSGTVFGVVTNGKGEPFAGAIIRGYDLAPRTPFIAGGQIDFDETFGYLATTADEQGAYALRDVTAGTAHMYVQKGGRHLQMGEPVPYAHKQLDVPPGGKVEWNPVVSNGRTIEGVVYFQDGHPMPNVFITLIDQKSGKQHVQTNNREGVFLFVNLDDAIYDVHVQVWDQPKDAPPLEQAGIVPDQGRVELRATFDKPIKKAKGTVTGRVDDLGLRIKNIKNAFVTLHSEERWFREGDKLVDGTFTFDEVTPCRFRLVLKEGDTVLGISDWHELLPGAQLDTGVLQTKPGGSVRIQVTRDAGTEACEPKLYFRGDGGVSSSVVRLGLRNEVLVTSLSPGQYRVTGYYKGMASITSSVTIAAGNTTNLTLQLKAGALTRFEVWVPPDQAVDHYEYSITKSTGEVVRNSKGTFGAQSRRPLAFAVTLPHGSYTIEFAADRAFTGKAPFTIDGTQLEQTVRVDLAPK